MVAVKIGLMERRGSHQPSDSIAAIAGQCTCYERYHKIQKAKFKSETP